MVAISFESKFCLSQTTTLAKDGKPKIFHSPLAKHTLHCFANTCSRGKQLALVLRKSHHRNYLKRQTPSKIKNATRKARQVEACNMTLSRHPLRQLIIRQSRDQPQPGLSSAPSQRREPGNEVDRSSVMEFDCTKKDVQLYFSYKESTVIFSSVYVWYAITAFNY